MASSTILAVSAGSFSTVDSGERVVDSGECGVSKLSRESGEGGVGNWIQNSNKS